MNWQTVTFVRVYLTEAEHKLKPLLKRLHDVDKVHGVTVFRGITGFGSSGVMHTASLVDLAPDLPVVVEFYDRAEKVDAIMDHLSELVEAGHIVRLQAQCNL
jgi:PII-like signaling protein